MAVQSQTSSISYAGNNSTTVAYPVPFLFFRPQDLVVQQANPQGLVAAVPFTASGAGNDEGGSIVTTVAVPPENTLTIARVVEATQLTSYQEGGDFPAASHERALDKLTMLVQQIVRTELRTVRFGETVGNIDPIAALLPNRVIGTDASGQLAMLPPVQAGFKYKGQVTTLPASGDKGDVYTLMPSNEIFVWDGGWILIGTLSVGNDVANILSTSGDLLTRDSLQPVRLPLGVNGKFLRAGVSQPFYGDANLEDIKQAGAVDKQAVVFSTSAGKFVALFLDPSFLRGTATNGQTLTFNAAQGHYVPTDALTKADGLVPSGTIVQGTRAPNSNFLILNGEPVSRSLNPDLFAIYGETFGAGNGSTTFHLPYPEPWRWHKQSSTLLPAARTYGTLNALPDGRLLWIGGIVTGTTRSPVVWIGTLKGDSITWIESTSLPAARSEHATVIASDGRIFVVGGANAAGTPVNTVTVGTLSGDSITWVENSSLNMAGLHARHTANILPDGRILVMGGISTGGDSGAALSTTEIGTISGNTISWVAGTALPVPLRTHTANLLPNGDLLVVGGQSTAVASQATVYRVSVSGNTLSFVTQTAYLSLISRHCTVIAPDGTVMVFGGFVAANTANSYFGRFLTDGTLFWDSLTVLPAATREAAADILPDGRIVIAGGLVGAPISNQFIQRVAGPFHYIRR